jgi:molecular chaperone DnaJ
MLGRSPLLSSFVSSDTVGLTSYHHDDSMSTCEDPFAILGVRCEASLDEIKRAYRRLAMFWHPDRNPSAVAGTEFKRVHAAYELLLDPQRLAEWRQAQATTMTNAGGTATGNAADDLTQVLTLSLEEAAQGCRKDIELMHSVRCVTCSGSGRVQHNHSVPCQRCNGCGRLARKGGGTHRCEGCNGRGYLRETVCPDCASGWRMESRILSVTVPPGLRDGERLRLPRQAPAKPAGDGHCAGDLYLEVSLAAHPLFVLDGRDLHCDVPVSVLRLLCGGSIDVPTLSGTVSLDLPPAQVTLEHRLPGQGFPGKRGRGAGDLIVHLQGIQPQNVGPQDIEFLEDLQARLATDLERHAPQLAAWESQMRARRRQNQG